MPNFAIFGPKLGLAESVPRIALSEAFIADGSENVLERYGQYQKLRGRLADLLDITNNDKIACPTDVYEISAINTSTKTITITGNHQTGAGANYATGVTVLAVGDTIRINGHSTDANNVEYTVASLPTSSTITVTEAISSSTAAGYVFVGTTPVIRYHLHTKESSGTEYLLLATGSHIFLWTYSNRSLTVKHTCASVCTRWEIVTHIDNVYATNNVDKVVWWNVEAKVGNSFAVCDDASNGLDIDNGLTYIVKARHITSFESSLIVGYVTDSDGGVHPSRIIGAAIDTSGATIDFQYDVITSDAWKKDFSGTDDFLMGFGKYGDYLIIGKQRSMYRGYLTTQDIPFVWDEETVKVGVLSGDTFCNSKDGRLFFLASDMTIRELGSAVPISTLVDVTIRSVNTSVAEYSQASFIDKYNMIALALPVGSSTTNNKLVCIEVDKGSWFIQDIAVRCFGEYTQQETYTYNTLPFDNYNDWGAAWLIYDTDVNVEGFPLELVSDYSGYTYDLFRADKDAGSAFTGAVVFGTSLDAKRASLGVFKRINNGAYIYATRQGSGSLTLQAKRDNESSWQSLGTASMVDSTNPEIVRVHVPFDIRARFYEFKISSENYFELIGIEFLDFEVEDER